MVNKMVDTADLLDAGEVAEILGLSRRTSVSVYRARYDDFPEPVVVKNSGMCDLWLRPQVVAWAKSRGRKA